MKKELTPRKRQAIEMRAKIQSAALTLFNRAAPWAIFITTSRARTSWLSR